MLHRVPQPPVNPALRNPERHDFWPAFIAVIIGLMLVVCGTRRLTAVETTDGDTAREMDLVKAFSSGGLKYAAIQSPPPPPIPGDPQATAEALDRWVREMATARERGPAGAKVRVDLRAKTPCPT